MPNAPRSVLFALAVIAGCGGPPAPTPASPASTAAAPAKPIMPLSGLVGENVIIAPVQALRIPAEIGWPAAPASRLILARLDSLIADTLRARVGNQKWVFADGLATAVKNNPTYATNPHQLAVNPLRNANLKIDDRLTEPLASQLRTMIAFQDARLVLIPVHLSVERVSAGIGRPTVRLVLVDPRRSVVRWIGQVEAPDSPAFTPDISASIAGRLADLFVAK